MTQVKDIMKLVEAYRTSGGREEHFARRDVLENALEELIITYEELRTFYDLGYAVGATKLNQSRYIDAASIEIWKSRLAEAYAENVALRKANLHCMELFNELMHDYNELKQGKHAN